MTLLFVAACSIPLTQEGATVPLVSERERDNCEFIEVVTGSMALGADTGDDAESAMNEARNKAAALGANGLRVLSSTSTNDATTVLAEALRCP